MKCTYIPSKGANLFRQLKKQFGYELAKDIFLRAISPRFIEDFRKTLSLDTEGVPSFESVMNNSWMKNFIGDVRILESLNTFKPLEDTLENFNICLEEAYRFNNNSTYDNYVATVEYTDDGKIVTKVFPRTTEAVEKFNNQYGTYKLNKSLASIFEPAGVTVGKLTEAEVSAGRIGNIDFSKAKRIAQDFKSIIRVANNMEGAQAVSEEFSHLVVALFKQEPLTVRALNTLKNNEDALRKVLGDDYQDVYDYHNGNLELIAEEALGQLLQKNLIAQQIETGYTSFFNRFRDFIVSKFKNFNLSDVDKAIQDADNAMNSLAKKITTNTLQVTKEDIENINRDESFNALSNRIERNIDILKNAIKVETKRFKINTDVDADSIKLLIAELRKHSGENSDTIAGLTLYAENAIENLKGLYEGLGNSNGIDLNDKAIQLRKVLQYLQSYAKFIEELTSAYNEEKDLEDNIFNIQVTEDYTLGDLFDNLNNLNTKLANEFKNQSITLFSEFIEGYTDKLDIEARELIQTATGDIGFIDRWLQSMEESSDVLLKVFDLVVKKAKAKARHSTIKSIQKIQAWMKKAEEAGYTDFEWMFEHNSEGAKTGNYISEVNIGEFEYQLDLFLKNLDAKYGKNPAGEQAKKKIAEKKEWLDKNSYEYGGKRYPKNNTWQNSEYTELSSKQKKLLNEFKAIKDELDKLIPENKLTSNLAIQIRKSKGQRFIESATSPSQIFENIKNGFRSEFYDSEDDDQIFGATVRKGLTNFDDTEYMVLPVQYTNRLKNPNELSTDVVGSLMAYAYMCHQYNELENIINPMEIGRTIVKEFRKTKKTRGNNPLVERVEALGSSYYNDIVHTEGTNIEKKLDDFYESQIYQRYIKDEGVVGKFNVAKTVNKALEYSALAQLGFNWLANIANVAQGICMSNIEVAAGQYFTFSDLLSADKEYISLMKDFIPEIGSRVKTNKLSLLGDYFNLKQDFDTQVKRNNKKNILQKIFGANIAFLGQEAGDHWLYYRVAIAHMKHTKIIINGAQTTVWDALKVQDSEVGYGIKEMSMDEAYNLDGSKFDKEVFGMQIATINHNLFGIYNTEDANAANRIALGRALMQYRKWMVPLYKRRFGAETVDITTGERYRGYYRTLIKVVQELRRGEIQFSMLKDQLSERDLQDLKRAVFEIAQFLAAWGASEFIDWPDDEDRPWALKLAEYASHRLAHELGGLTPSPAMINETLKTVKTPFAMLSAVQNTANLATSLLDPRDWTDELQSGPYKGMSTLEKNFVKAPLPGIAQYRQIDKFVGDLDNSIMYYLRPY